MLRRYSAIASSGLSQLSLAWLPVTRLPLALSIASTIVLVSPGIAQLPDPNNPYGYPTAPRGSENRLACYMRTSSGQVINLDVFCTNSEAPTASEPRLGTGDVQVTLRWRTKDDLDLAVKDPSGQTVFFREPKSPSGGELDVDSNADCVRTVANPVENVFWPTGGAPAGQYQVQVVLYRACEQPSNQARQIPFTLTVLNKGRTTTFNGAVSLAKPRVDFPPFSVSAGAAAPSGANTPPTSGSPSPAPGMPPTPGDAPPAASPTPR